MARTHSKPGPKPKYGDREEIHVLIPADDLQYIRSVTNNTTEWIIQAIQEKRHHASKLQSAMETKTRHEDPQQLGEASLDIDTIYRQHVSLEADLKMIRSNRDVPMIHLDD